MTAVSRAAFAVLSTLFSAAVWAQSASSRDAFDPPSTVSEPGTLPLLALAVAGAVGVARYLKNRKK